MLGFSIQTLYPALACYIGAMPFRLKVSLAILLGMLTLLLVGPLIIPIRPLPDTVPARDLADPDSQFIDVNGLELHYKSAGTNLTQPPAFVLLHGFGSSSYTWNSVIDEFGLLGPAYAFDRPGFGLSERPLGGEWGGQNPYSFEAQTEQTLGLMDELGLEQAIFIAHSAAAAIALNLALDYPERVSGLVLVGAAVYNENSSGAARLFMRTPQLNRVGPIIMRQFAAQPGRDFLETAWSDPEKLDDATLEAYAKPLSVNDWDKALWEYAKANRPPELEAQLSNVNVPVLVITGADDAIVAPSLSEQLVNDLPDATLASFDSCGHLPQEECPEPFSVVVTDWVLQNIVNSE